MQLAAAPPAFVRLPIPTGIQHMLDAAVREGTHGARHWSHTHPGGSAADFDRDLLASVKPPPTGAAQEADLAISRAAIPTRTDGGNQAADYLARSSGWDVWNDVMDEIKRTQGPAQAERAVKLLDEARERNSLTNKASKEQWGRLRPYQADPTISTVVPRPDGNASYPSGHSAGAYVISGVLGALLPSRAAELRAVADQVAWSRVYGGVHFSTDVILGARMGAQIAADVLRRGAAADVDVAAAA